VCTALFTVYGAGAAAPPFKFAAQIGGTNQDLFEAVVVDRPGNTYVLGGFLLSITLGNTNLTAQTTLDDFGYGDTTSFLAKYNSSGVLQWARKLGGTNLFASALALDDAGNLFVAGHFAGSADLDVTNLTSQGSPDLSGHLPNDIFLAKLSNNGQVLWAR